MGLADAMAVAPELVGALAEVGRRMPPLRTIIGEDSLVFGFSDYREEGTYSTSTLFLTSQSHLNLLTQRLADVRIRLGITSHALEYKTRKNWSRFWPSATEAWMEVLRETPGLAVCVACSDRFRADEAYKRLIRAVTQLLTASGRKVNGRRIAIALRKLMPFLIVAPLLKTSVLGWVSDRDSLLQGELGRELLGMVLSMIGQAGSTVSVVQPVYEGCLPKEHELALSLPDLVSGVVADLFPSPFKPTTVDASTLDREAFRILAALALFSGPFQEGHSPCRLHVSLLDRLPDGWAQLPIELRAQAASAS